MIQSKPNSNLLTVADGTFQQHLVSLVIYFYIYRQIQMVLGANAPHLTEESLDYKTVRSDRLVATLCRPNLATWRHKVSHEAFGGAQGEEGTPPWLLLAAVPANTPSVSDEPTFFGGGSGSGATTTNSSRITGMYFYHPDHLGSITMITDGRGNVLAGGERGGKSHITYRPYGEILRTDSFGPDISKYKYTGQEEDRESGLMFYKARYYDSKIGRFLQADSMAFPNQIQGMNRMMYVEGNPVSYRDPSGNNKYIHMFNRIVGHAMGKKFGNNSGVKLSSQNFFKGIGDRLSLPRKVGTKEGWKQAVVAGLQTNWDLTAMAQGYYLGQQQAKKQRLNANLVVGGMFKIVLGAIAVIIGGLIIESIPWLSASLFVIGTSLIADGGDDYNRGIGKKSEEDKQKILYCGKEGFSNDIPYICFYGSVSPSE
ncbi:MAG: RHS repeat-associated core domain-containing protein [Leptospiraceae bacterium]|nr:RHS repeat-associated core domain-containing protein [Leptospiraceae bacterium]